jgi:hypothetical protein
MIFTYSVKPEIINTISFEMTTQDLRFAVTALENIQGNIPLTIIQKRALQHVWFELNEALMEAI